VRGVGQAALRLREAAQMGFTRCLLPARSLPDRAVMPDGIEAVGVQTLQDALERLFT
jgi:DNA repair protein RadA/Sms